ncbi:hypothetical protein A2671_00255 [Candidatus Kaiserbacteria bacterium RIFCSPHIGHO2_01_FULL_49_13]|uniref:Uncharacterized protein n=1 Tax=Candidatus Kaiserbacteria bacterium RIFCSPHIGHO2_01_FULL_49_13 TaxID=1798477 RepID=A0A1F6CEJ5_9BACT|nr:MAG: hypothetical protein A2671_00255 [Candidatus Kaiserbacteria bacterium RIFCSPHIGHO2_01_FULL_49_13]
MLKKELNASWQIAALTMPTPSNFHAHLREGSLGRAIARSIMQNMKYLLVMPNLTSPVRTIEDAHEYHASLRQIMMEEGFCGLELLMTLYYTDSLTPSMIEKIARTQKSRHVHAIKYYPPAPHATTGSGHGIPLVPGCDILRAMEECGVPLLGHFETVHDKNNHELPHAEREAYCIKNELPYIRDRHLNLLISVEHATTCEAVDFVKGDTSGNTWLTATPQHLNFTEEDLKIRSWRNLLKCMPIEKTLKDLEALVAFVTSGDERAITGDDDAPHLSNKKWGMPLEKAANGCFLPHSIYLYAKAFQKAGALDERFEKFMCFNGPKRWKLPPPALDEAITIRFDTQDPMIPVRVPEEKDEVLPLGWSNEPDRLTIGPL